MKNRKVIIFGNSHHNTLGLVRSVGEIGIRPILLLEPCDLGFCCVRFSKYIAKIHYLKDLADGLNVLHNEYWNETEKPIILVAGDPTMCLLDAHYDELKDHFYIFNARGGQGRINYFMDKVNQFPVAAQSGFELIRTWCVNTKSDFPSDIVYPCLTKGNNSTTSSKGDMFICKNRESLKKCLRDGVEYLVQEYIEKEYELDIIGLAWNHGRDVYVPAVVRKIRDDIHRQSAYERLDDINDYADFDISKIKAFVGEVGYEGIFSIETICRDHKYYFLEANFRNDGCGYLYTAGGINYPYLWIKYCEGECMQELVASVKPNFSVHMMSAEDVWNCLEGKVPIFRWIGAWLRVEAHAVRNYRDMKPYFYLLWIFARQGFLRVLRPLWLTR